MMLEEFNFDNKHHIAIRSFDPTNVNFKKISRNKWFMHFAL